MGSWVQCPLPENLRIMEPQSQRRPQLPPDQPAHDGRGDGEPQGPARRQGTGPPAAGQAAPSPAPPAPALPPLSCPGGCPGLGRAGGQPKVCRRRSPRFSPHWKDRSTGQLLSTAGPYTSPLDWGDAPEGPACTCPHTCVHTPPTPAETPCTQAHSRHICAQGHTEALEAAGRDTSLQLLRGVGAGT